MDQQFLLSKRFNLCSHTFCWSRQYHKIWPLRLRLTTCLRNLLESCHVWGIDVYNPSSCASDRLLKIERITYSLSFSLSPNLEMDVMTLVGYAFVPLANHWSLFQRHGKAYLKPLLHFHKWGLQTCNVNDSFSFLNSDQCMMNNRAPMANKTLFTSFTSLFPLVDRLRFSQTSNPIQE